MSKNIKIKALACYVTAFSLVAALSSCKHYLDLNPVSTFGPNVVFGTVANAQSAVLGVYQNLAGDQGYGTRLSMYYPYDDDCIMGANGQGDGDKEDMGRYNLTSTNQELLNPFNRLYQGIEYANQCIQYIPQMDLYTNGTATQQGELRRLYGESLALRAQFYFELIRNWGDVPAEWSPSSELPNLFLAKTDRDSIYDHILNDLQTAEALVPWRSGVAALGDNVDERLTKGGVKALRARIALYRGGWSLRGSQMQRPSDYLAYYQIADTECASIISSGEHALDPSFQDLWQNQLDAHKIDPYGEFMFLVAMAGGTSTTDSKLGYYDGPQESGNGELLALPTYFYMFDSTDTRLNVTVAPFEINTDGTLAGNSITSINDGKFRRNWITNPTIPISDEGEYFELDWPVIRYSDVLLMYAEAENEINGGPTAAAITAYEQVRQRAYSGTDPDPVPSGHNNFFTALVNERAREFGAEGIRKYDLIRWDSLGAKLAEAKVALQLISDTTKTGNATTPMPPYQNCPTHMYYYSPNTSTQVVPWANSFYQPTPATQPNGTTSVTWAGASSILTGKWQYFAEGFVEGKSELFPFPQQALDANPNLTQNFGY